MAYKIVSDHKLSSNWLPQEAFTQIYESRSSAVATAIEGVDDPKIQKVCVINIDTDSVIWDSTKADYEEDYYDVDYFG